MSFKNPPSMDLIRYHFCLSCMWGNKLVFSFSTQVHRLPRFLYSVYLKLGAPMYQHTVFSLAFWMCSSWTSLSLLFPSVLNKCNLALELLQRWRGWQICGFFLSIIFHLHIFWLLTASLHELKTIMHSPLRTYGATFISYQASIISPFPSCLFCHMCTGCGGVPEWGAS